MTGNGRGGNDDRPAAGIYERLSSVYDVVFGRALQPGRARAIGRMNIQSGDRILEVGAGTGINLGLYPRDCQVTGIDLSRAMLDKARQRVLRKRLRHVRLLQMDAATLAFPDHAFDVVYAAYVVSAVPDPVAVVREMNRVCRPGGRLVILNHFLSANPLLASIERAISPYTVHAGFKSDLDLSSFLGQARLRADRIEKVNSPRLWSLVTCFNDRRSDPRATTG